MRYTPLDWEASSGDAEGVKWLIERGADVNKRNPLYEAAENGHIEIVKLLIEKGADANRVPPLRRAARNAEIIELLKVARERKQHND